MKRLNVLIDKEMMINQERFENMVDSYIENNLNLTSAEVSHYKNYARGGNCKNCQKPYRPDKVNDKLSDYVRYEPTCKCYEYYTKKKNDSENLKKIKKVSGLPLEFLNTSISDLTYQGIERETVDAINMVKEYLNKRLYSKNIGCILYGHVGTGKTHMAVSILKHIMLELKCSGKFLHMSDIITEILSSRFDYIKELGQNKVVCFDDMDKLSMGSLTGQNEWKAERIFSLFNHLTSNNKIIIGTSNCESIEDFGDRFDKAIVSRLAYRCKFIRVYGLDYRILKRKHDEDFKL